MEYILKRSLSEVVDIMEFKRTKSCLCLLELLLLVLSLCVVWSLDPLTAYAIDNPDAPDYIGDFNTRSQPFIDAVNDPKNNARKYQLAYSAYENFLDKELSRAYQLLLGKLSPPQKQELINTQRHWVKFRDAEFTFIIDNWTNVNFGSSAAMSRGAYRCTIIKDRVTQLLYYAKNY